LNLVSQYPRLICKIPCSWFRQPKGTLAGPQTRNYAPDLASVAASLETLDEAEDQIGAALDLRNVRLQMALACLTTKVHKHGALPGAPTLQKFYFPSPSKVEPIIQLYNAYLNCCNAHLCQFCYKSNSDSKPKRAQIGARRAEARHAVE
jgi:hypothetical protein